MLNTLSMGKKMIYDLANFIEFTSKYFQGDKTANIAFGLRPSGIVHLGNLLTLALAADVVNRTGPHLAKLNLAILDLDLPATRDWNFISEKYVKHYKDLPCEGYSSFSERTRDHIEDFMDKLNQEMRVPFELTFLSDLQKDPKYRKGLKNILESEEARKIISPTSKNGRIEAYPLCRKCGTSYTNTIKGKINEFDNDIISTHCTNPECDVKDYEVNIFDPSVDIAVGTLMGALRDFADPMADAHVYGGDYFCPHGESKEPKVEKIKQIMDIANPKRTLDFLVGPLIFAKGRLKMSKSLHNGVDYNNLKNLFGDDYVKRILDFTWGIVEEGYSMVDFAVVQKDLLG